MKRRSFLVGSGACLAASWGAGCQRVATRESVLRQLVLEVAVPDLRALPETSASLVQALQLAAKGGSLGSARTALQKALLAWQRVQAFRNGPAVDSNALLRSTFWPSREQSIAAVIEGSAAIDAALVENLGVDAKGLYALELMLFDAEFQSSWFDATHAPRALALATAFAVDVRARAQAVQELLGDGHAFADKFAAGGQESINRLVNQLVETSETIAADRLLRVLGLQEHDRLLPGQLHGGYSGLSTQLALAWLTATQRLYLGAHESGLCTLVKQVAPEIDKRVREAFAAAVASLKALDGPLEQVVLHARPRLQEAASKAKALEVALKSDLAASLGVTLSIVSGDGD